MFDPDAFTTLTAKAELYLSALRSDFGDDGWRKGLDWAVAMLRAALFEGRGRSGSPFRAWKGDNSRRVQRGNASSMRDPKRWLRA